MSLCGGQLKFVSELKYLGVYLVAAKCFKISVNQLKVKFFRVFNCIYARSKAANSEMVTVELLKAYCLPFLANVNSRSRSLYAVARPSVVCLSCVTLVHPTQAVQLSTAFGTLAIH